MKEEIIERCGFCGRYFKGVEYLTHEELAALTGNEPLGYCPNAQQEDGEQNPEVEERFVTRDMAIDAGSPSLEGHVI